MIARGEDLDRDIEAEWGVVGQVLSDDPGAAPPPPG